MKKRKVGKYLGLTLGCTVVCATAFFALSATNVFGQFIPDKPYVTGGPAGNTAELITVTDEGGNRKGDQGSGAAVLNDDVPPAVGQKGSETNPFVLLEIVPEHEQQQMIYMNGKDAEYPLDVLRIGLEACDKQNKNFVNFKDITNFDLNNSPGEWFCRYGYEIYKFGEDEKTETVPLAEIDKLYTFEISEKDIKAAGYNPGDFKNAHNYNNCKIKDMMNKFPALFSKNKGEMLDSVLEKDDNWYLALGDERNWEKTSISSHEIEVSADDVNQEGGKLSLGELVKKYPNAFEKDQNGDIIDKKGKIVTEEELQDSSAWNSSTSNYTVDHTVEFSAFDVAGSVDSNTKIANLASQNPGLFSTDKNGDAITAAELEDQANWKLNTSTETQAGWNGYMIYVGKGKGNFDMLSGSSISQWGGNGFFGKGDTNYWIYSETLPEGNTFPLRDKPGIDQLVANRDFSDEASLMGGYFTGNDFSWYRTLAYDKYTFTYSKQKQVYVFKTNQTNYAYTYYGLKTNDVLKRMLFIFNSEEECNDFNMRVIAMTPAEINEAVKDDTSDKLDIIERADMFYVGSYDSQTNNIKQVYELYHKFILGEDNYNFSSDKMKSFAENDLNWSSCYKILDRLCRNANLPLMLTQGLGKMVNEGVDGTENTHMYVQDGHPTSQHNDEEGSLCNMAKLYLLTVQFDMLARTEDTNGDGKIDKNDDYVRTFYNDILPQLQTININNDAMKNADKNTASNTGYYQRWKLVDGDKCGSKQLTTEEKETCYYLWNIWTFYPPEVPLASNGEQKGSSVDEYVKYGYLESFFKNDAGDVFAGKVSNAHKGSDGYDGKNVGIVYSDTSTANSNFSTLLGATESSGNLNTAMNTAFQIMNKQSPQVEPMTIKVEKQKKEYLKISDNAILIDYSKNADYGNGDEGNDKDLYVKLTITNRNNDAGIIKSIKLVENEADKAGIEKTPRKERKKEPDSSLSKESIRDINNQNPVTGYRVPVNGSLTIYVPYKLSEWKAGKTMIQLVTQGRKYMEKKSKKETTLGSTITNYVSISERTLFNLE